MVQSIANDSDEVVVYNCDINDLRPLLQTPAILLAIEQGSCCKELYISKNLRQRDRHRSKVFLQTYPRIPIQRTRRLLGDDMVSQKSKDQKQDEFQHCES